MYQSSPLQISFCVPPIGISVGNEQPNRGSRRSKNTCVVVCKQILKENTSYIWSKRVYLNPYYMCSNNFYKVSKRIPIRISFIPKIPVGIPCGNLCTILEFLIKIPIGIKISYTNLYTILEFLQELVHHIRIPMGIFPSYTNFLQEFLQDPIGNFRKRGVVAYTYFQSCI